MNRTATAIAHPNIALAKYWGKRPGGGNFPAVPSLSVTLAGLATTTRVAWRDDLEAHRVVLNGRALDGQGAERAAALLDGVRKDRGVRGFAEVESTNDFPTASGLASSASGFAALSLAAERAAGSDATAAEVSDRARRASASAARSVFGGFVELGVGEASARPVAPVDHLDLRVLVAVTTEGAKGVGSTAGMRATAEASPYYGAWVERAPKTFADLRAALLAKDFAKMGELAEGSALAMHACAIAAGLVYWNGATIEALATVRALRARATAAYATIDAGPHVKVLTLAKDARDVAEALAHTPGVLRVIEARPGEGASLA